MTTTRDMCCWMLVSSVLLAFALSPVIATSSSGLVSTVDNTTTIDPIGITQLLMFGQIYTFVADARANTIYQLTPYHTIIAGTNVSGFADGSAISARFNGPTGMCAANDTDTNSTATTTTLFVCDTGNHAIRMIVLTYNLSGALIQSQVTTVAGVTGQIGFYDGDISDAMFAFPRSVVYMNGELLVADTYNHAIRLITNGTVVTVAGNGEPGHQDGNSTVSELSYPMAITIPIGLQSFTNNTNNIPVYILHNHAVLYFNIADYNILTIAGSSEYGYMNGYGLTARFNGPSGIAIDNNDIAYISDTGNSVIRVLTNFSSFNNISVTTMTGKATKTGFLDGIPSTALFTVPSGLSLLSPLTASSSLLYVCDSGNAAIRSITAVCAQPCLNGGNCSANNYCECPSNYLLDDCSQPYCSPACPTTVDGTVCLSPQVCGCPVGYSGNMCAEPICSSSCLNGGNCSAPNTCSCPVGWSGALCEEPVCASPCGSYGTCVGANTCQCASGWSGSQCNIPICTSTCMNGGNCTQPNVCVCPTTWSGGDCSQPVCNHPCLNGGSCTSPGMCTCASGWTGTNCSSPICSTSCQNNGTCTAPDTCTCQAGWTNTSCSTPICSQTCLNGGHCAAPNTCSCASGWIGYNCSVPICSSCTSTEVCIAPNVCQSLCPYSCNNGGSCNGATQVCQCANGWSGNDCTTPFCSSGCVNGGVCTGPQQCTCQAGYNGSTCAHAICSPACQHGSCTAPNTCECVSSSWGGSTCAVPQCSDTCQNDGVCTPDAAGVVACQCTSEWAGATCTVAICDPLCENGGTCTSPNVCECPTGYTGATCSDVVTVSTTLITSAMIEYFIFACAGLGAIILLWFLRCAWDYRMKRRYIYQSEFDVIDHHEKTARKKEKERARARAIVAAANAGVPLDAWLTAEAQEKRAKKKADLMTQKKSVFGVLTGVGLGGDAPDFDPGDVIDEMEDYDEWADDGEDVDEEDETALADDETDVKS